MSSLTCALIQFCVCIVRLLLACIVVSCVFARFWNFFAHLRESILQWPMILRQIFFVYQRTTHTPWRGRDAIGRRFLDTWRLKETYFQLGFISEKMFCGTCGGVCTQIVVLRDKQIPTMLSSVSCLYQFKVGCS